MDQQKASNLPKNWLDCSLGEVIDYGKTQKAEVSSINNNTWVLELEDIEKHSSKIIQKLTFETRQSKSSKNKFEKGDVLYGKLRPYLNKVVIADDDGICSSEIIPIKCDESFIDSRYMFSWLKNSKFLSYVDDVSYGVNMPRLGTKDGKNAPFRLAPLPEQKRIVEKLDSLLAQVDTIQQRLNNLPDIIKRFRQSVLAAAVSGKLTEQWRKKNEIVENSYETPRYLVDLINPERPITYGVLKPGDYIDGGIPLLRIKDILSETINTAESHKISVELSNQYKRSQLEGGEILISLVGTIGRIGLVTSSLSGANVHRNLGVIAPKDELMSKFLFLQMKSDFVQKQIRKARTGANQPLLNLGDIKKLHISVPSIEEQTEIVRLVEQHFALADTLEKNLANAKQRVDNLTQSILAKAFKGELVPQDPNDEPADKLLERIKAAREEAEKLEKAAKKVAKTKTHKVSKTKQKVKGN